MMMAVCDDVKKIYTDLAEYLESTGRFGEVVLGLPETLPQFRRALATLYPARMEFHDSMGRFSLPQRLHSELWVVYRGIRPSSFLQALDDLVFLLGEAQTNEAFFRAGHSSFLTSIGRVTYTPVVSGKTGYLAVRYELEHDVTSVIH